MAPARSAAALATVDSDLPAPTLLAPTLLAPTLPAQRLRCEVRHLTLCAPLDQMVLLPMGRADIADRLGLTTETVSRTFTRFKTGGLISLQGRVALRDRPALKERAAGG